MRKAFASKAPPRYSTGNASARICSLKAYVAYCDATRSSAKAAWNGTCSATERHQLVECI